MMVYFTPIRCKCGECGFEMDYSQSDLHPFLPVSDDGYPFCYKCLIEFIAKNVPAMKLVPDKPKEPDIAIVTVASYKLIK